MTLAACSLCQREVDAKRKIGVGSLILFFCTAGLWTLFLPFYRKRCPICHTTNVKLRFDIGEVILKTFTAVVLAFIIFGSYNLYESLHRTSADNNSNIADNYEQSEDQASYLQLPDDGISDRSSTDLKRDERGARPPSRAGDSAQRLVNSTPPPVPAVSERSALPKVVQDAIRLDDACRGGEDNLELICKERDGAFEEAQAQGWCLGDVDVPNADATWHRCRP